MGYYYLVVDITSVDEKRQTVVLKSHPLEDNSHGFRNLFHLEDYPDWVSEQLDRIISKNSGLSMSKKLFRMHNRIKIYERRQTICETKFRNVTLIPWDDLAATVWQMVNECLKHPKCRIIGEEIEYIYIGKIRYIIEKFE